MRRRTRAAEVVTSITFYCLAAYICFAAAARLAAALHIVQIDHFSGPLHWGWSVLTFVAMVVTYLAWFRTLQPDLSQDVMTRTTAAPSQKI
jgi:drug/metabolite transporter (DMT)-like permease